MGAEVFFCKRDLLRFCLEKFLTKDEITFFWLMNKWVLIIGRVFNGTFSEILHRQTPFFSNHLQNVCSAGFVYFQLPFQYIKFSLETLAKYVNLGRNHLSIYLSFVRISYTNARTLKENFLYRIGKNIIIFCVKIEKIHIDLFALFVWRHKKYRWNFFSTSS